MDKPRSDPASLTKNVQSRREQIAAWEASETSKASSKLRQQLKVKFRFEIAFLAACSSSDFEEITRLLQDEKVDINTSNVDGLTALHQACIDNKLELVRFLCEHGANLHARDNEGWTPLHATAIGGHTEIAKYLIKRGASLAVANSDGDLPHDVAEQTEMKNLLQNGLAALEESAAKSAEADAMQRDAEEWLREGRYRDVRDPVANAGPLHVAAAKGYQQALVTLLQCPGAPIEAVDSDGWTALHAAAHWGQEDACRALVAHGASMDAVTNANQTVFDLADNSVKQLLTELKMKQTDLMQESKVRKRPVPSFSAALKIEDIRGHTIRRSSVTRLPQSERHDITQKGAEQEKHPELLARNSGPDRSPLASTESLSSDDELRLQQQQYTLPRTANLTSLSLSSTAPSSLQQQRPSPSPPAFVVTELPPPSPPPRQQAPVIGLGSTVGSRRIEIITATTTAGSASASAPTISTPAVTAPSASVLTTSASASTSASAADASLEPVAPRGGSKVRSILTRMESLQETSSSSSSSSSTGSGTTTSNRQSQILSGRGSAAGNQRVKSAIGMPTVNSSGTLDTQLVSHKTEPAPPRLSQSQDLSVDRQSTAAPAKSPSATAGTTALLSDQRNGGRISSSIPHSQPLSSLAPLQQASAASRRVSVIMEKEKTDESETERRRISRHNRATKRLTQGVTPDDVEQAKKIMEARIATVGPTNADAVDTAPAIVASAPDTQTPVVLAAASALTGQRRNLDRSEAFTASDTNNSRLTRTRPDSYHGGPGPSSDPGANRLQDSGSGGRSASPIDYRKLYERERTRTDRLFEENSRMRQELDQLKTQQQQIVKVDKRLSDYEAQEKAAQAESELNRLRLENSKLKADNTSLIRVISRLSSQPSST